MQIDSFFNVNVTLNVFGCLVTNPVHKYTCKLFFTVTTYKIQQTLLHFILRQTKKQHFMLVICNYLLFVTADSLQNCNMENNQYANCGITPVSGPLEWIRHRGSTPTEQTGPMVDQTTGTDKGIQSLHIIDNTYINMTWHNNNCVLHVLIKSNYITFILSLISVQ